MEWQQRGSNVCLCTDLRIEKSMETSKPWLDHVPSSPTTSPLSEICQRVIKSSARIFASVADGIKRPRDTNVIFIANQAPRYFRLAYAPSSVFSDQKVLYRRDQRNRRKQQTRGKRRRGYWSSSLLLCEVLFSPVSILLARCGKKSMPRKWRKEKTGRG